MRIFFVCIKRQQNRKNESYFFPKILRKNNGDLYLLRPPKSTSI